MGKRKLSYEDKNETPKAHIVIKHLPEFVEWWGICGVFGEDGAEALHVTDTVCRRIVRTMRNAEQRHRAMSLHHLVMVYTPAVNRETIRRGPRKPKGPAAAGALPVEPGWGLVATGE